MPHHATTQLIRIVGRPFGVDEDERQIDQVSGRLIVAAIDELRADVEQRAAAETAQLDAQARAEMIARAQTQALDELVQMLNAALPDERYHITLPYLHNESNNYSREFWLFVVNYCRTLSGDERFFFNHARRIPSPTMISLLSPFTLHQVYSVMPRMSEKVSETDWRVVHTTPTSATVQLHNTAMLSQVPPHHHTAFVHASCQTTQGVLAALPSLRYPALGLAHIRELRCQLRGDICCEWEFTWSNPRPRPRKRLIAGALASLVILYVLLALPEARALGVFAAALPIVFAWYSWRISSLTHDRNQHQEQLLEQQRLAEEQYDNVRRANADFQLSNFNLEQKIGELSALHDIGLALSTSLDLNDLLERSLRAVTLWLKFDRAMVMLVDEERHMLAGGKLIGGTPTMQTLIKELHVSLDDPQSVLINIYNAYRPVLVDMTQSTNADDQFFARVLNITSFLGTPLMSKGRTVGVLCVDNGVSRRPITPDEMPLLFTVASQIATAVEGVRLYQQIGAQNRELERRVHQRTLELAHATAAAQKARTAAEDANTSKSAFLANVSHELRTPLTSILGFTKLINKRVDEVIVPAIIAPNAKTQRAMRQVKDNLTIIISEGERLTALINDVLDLAKIEAGKIDWRMEPVLPAEIIGHATTATSALFMHKGLPLIIDVPDDLPAIIGDQNRLIQVVINLLSNAVKFTDAGAVTCSAMLDEHALVFSVTDTGIGIAPEEHTQVFDQFKQVGDTLTEKPKGTGLGLAISKQIVEHHGGRIWVTSTLGRGSVFAFSVPFVEAREG